MKKSFILVIFFLFFLTSCGKENKITEQKYYNTAKVQTGSISDADSFIGYTESFNSVSLSAKIGGKITTLSKKIGDNVKAGELIGTLDGSEALANLSSSEQIISSLNDLKNATSQSFDAQILAINEKIKQVQTGIDIANVGIEGVNIGKLDTQNIISTQLETVKTQIEQAKNSLDIAKIQYENSKNSLEQKEIDIYSNSKNAINNADILGNNVIDFLDNLLGVSEQNKYKNDYFEMYLSAKNTSLKTKGENDLKKIISKFENLKNMSFETNEDIEKTLKEYNLFFSNDLRNILKLTQSIMENTVDSDNFPQTSIQNYKTQITNLQSQNEQVIMNVSGQYILGLKGSLDNIENFKKEKKSSLDLLNKNIISAQKQIDTLNSTYNQYSSMGEGQINEVNTKNKLAIKQKEIAENSLNEALAGLESLKKQKEASLKQIDTQINEVKSGKNTSGVMFENGKIYSPINGIVTKKFGEIGQVVGAGMPIIEVATNTDIKIIVGVPNEIKNKISIGNEAKIEIEGFQEQITGKVTNILPTVDEITKKINIEIKVENPENKIKIGSYAKVYFDLGEKGENGIIIPNNAIVSNMLIPGVYVIESGKATFKNIKILKQNDNFSMIEGLNIGDEIITEGKENISDGEILIK